MMRNENVDFTWLREALIAHLLPCGKTGCQLNGTGDIASPVTYRTDKPIAFSDDKYPGIHSAISASERHEWLTFCYSPMPYHTRDSRFFSQVFNKALARSPSAIKGKSLKRYQSLILLAALDARAQLTNSPFVVTNKRLSSLMKIQPQTWRSTWLPRWELLIATFKEYDEEGLEFIAWSINNHGKRAS